MTLAVFFHSKNGGQYRRCYFGNVWLKEISAGRPILPLITITNTSSLCGYVRPNHHAISRHFVQTSSWRSKQAWFCWFVSICGHFPLANAMPFEYLKNIDDVFVIVIVFALVRSIPRKSLCANPVPELTLNNKFSLLHVGGLHSEPTHRR
jgi:hypothetical protein